MVVLGQIDLASALWPYYDGVRQRQTMKSVRMWSVRFKDNENMDVRKQIMHKIKTVLYVLIIHFGDAVETI